MMPEGFPVAAKGGDYKGQVNDQGKLVTWDYQEIISRNGQF